MKLDYVFIAIMFPAIPLMMSVFSNRFHTLSVLIRSMHDQLKYKKQSPAKIKKQFAILESRVTLMRRAQIFMGLSFLFNMFSVLLLFIQQEEFAKKVEQKLKKQGLRVISDLRNEKIGYKIREHSMQRYPYILVVGDREVENNQISVRQRGGQDLGSMSLEALIELINQE